MNKLCNQLYFSVTVLICTACANDNQNLYIQFGASLPLATQAQLTVDTCEKKKEINLHGWIFTKLIKVHTLLTDMP